MKINVHIKDKEFCIECDKGEQKMRWLGDVGIFRYSHFYEKIKSVTKGIKLENGDILDMESIIKETVSDNEHVWVIIQDENQEDENSQGEEEFDQADMDQEEFE